MRHTPQEPLASRLWRDMAAQLAERLGCCARYGTRLVCCLCDVAWDGSAGEERELDGFLGRAAVSHVPWPTWRCGRCGTPDAAFCVDCYASVSDEAFAGLTPGEEARCCELLLRYQRLTCLPDPDAADTGEQPHGGEGTS